MVMNDVIASISPPMRLSISYLKGDQRTLLALFLAFDSRMADIYEKMTEIMIAQIRLAWWRDTLSSEHKPKGEPLIKLIEEMETIFPEVAVSNILLAMIDGWEVLMTADSVMSYDDILSYADGRGSVFFAAIAELCGKAEHNTEFAELGAIWALYNLPSNKNINNYDRVREVGNQKLLKLDVRHVAKKMRALSLLSFPAIQFFRAKNKKRDDHSHGVKFGLSYVWHAITGRY